MANSTPQRPYKRSWKNLLINKDYQLRITLVLVGVSSLLMSGLGWWVMDQAHTATEVAINNVEGAPCERPPWMDAPNKIIVNEIEAMAPSGPVIPEPAEVTDSGAAPAGADDEAGKNKPAIDDDAADAADALDAPATAPEPPTGAADPGAVGAGDGERERPQVTITSSDMELRNRPSKAAAALAQVDASMRREQESRYHECKLAKLAKVDDLRNGESLIFKVLVGLGLFMVVGLAFYGIKMTHRVAGPLFKVTLYLRKLRNGKYDTVYNLRKGDHLVDFYAHFKSAHEGATRLVNDDIARLRAVLDAAEEANLAATSPELESAIAELRDLLADRESSIG